MKELRGKVAVVTGAASGIGLAISEAFVAEGMHVVLADRNADALREVGERLGMPGVVTDVRDPASVDALGRAVGEHFGELHVAVNNAGIVNGGKSWELTLDEWDAVLGVNLWGVIHGVRTFVPLLLAHGGEGHVVNTASMAAVTAIPGIAPYVVAKHGVLGLSDTLRAELASTPIGVSVVMPGMIRTGLNPVGTHSPDVVAANVVDAVKRDRPYVFTDHDSTDEVRTRLTAIVDARGEVLG